MSAFPTFRLPFVAAKAVVHRMDLGDLTALFLCSKKTREFVKSLRKPVSFDVLSPEQKESLNFLEMIELVREENLDKTFFKKYFKDFNLILSDDMGFQLNSKLHMQGAYPEDVEFKVYAECIDQQDQFEGTRKNLKIGDMEIPVVMTKKYVIYTFWDSKQEGFEKIGEYLKQKIISTIFMLDITVGSEHDFSENLRFGINWMNSTNKSLEHCFIEEKTDRINEDDFKFILDNVHPRDRYDMEVNLDDSFQHTPHFTSDSLHLRFANWLTLDNLFMMDCEFVELYESKLTNKDLNAYLKQWMAGKFPKLEGLSVEMQEDMNIDMILSGLEEGSRGSVIIRKDNSVHIERNGGYVAEISSLGIPSKTLKMKIS